MQRGCDAMAPVADDEIADALVLHLVPLAYRHMIGPMHVSDEIQSCTDRCDAPVGFDPEPVFGPELALDEPVDAMEDLLVIGHEHHVVHVSVVVLHPERLLDPMVEVREHERGEYLA